MLAKQFNATTPPEPSTSSLPYILKDEADEANINGRRDNQPPYGFTIKGPYLGTTGTFWPKSLSRLTHSSLDIFSIFLVHGVIRLPTTQKDIAGFPKKGNLQPPFRARSTTTLPAIHSLS
ncbi:hypothetical protein M407DRAFT_25195 [Tulasnella calospora MUT 4182]|uniref:Uncharacterized protein n=1 Tax=Tulasnella calospora MUT 4182 TaxID=1051891 RepID=A0A0C3KVJ6_9AGAM|nr:hypothetical protein M407DRAFT_25195 [Tulasnella calospora MUT 4182]